MKLKWDQTGEKLYENGVSQVVLFPFQKAASAYSKGVAWNGVTNITESPSGAEATKLWADNIQYANLMSAEEYGSNITAYTYPDEWAELDGSAEIADGVRIGQQNRGVFGLAYRTDVGNDTDGNDHGYKLHLVYGGQASPSEKSYGTRNDSPEAIEFSWDITTTPVAVDGFKPTATVVIDSNKVNATKLADFEKIIYGTDGTVSYSSVTPVGTENPSSEGWFEKNGTVYTATADTTVDSTKTYYKATESGGTTSRLPLPDEVASLLGTAIAG